MEFHFNVNSDKYIYSFIFIIIIIISNPDVYVRSTADGVEKVKKGGFAYILESTSNEYVRERDCDLIQIGGLLDNKGYGFATPSGSMWTNQISSAILQVYFLFN